MSSVRRSLAYALADNYLGMVLQLISTLVISRLLSPTEIGIFAVAAMLGSWASTFRDFGVAEYLIQAKELTHERIRAALAANIMLSWAMAFLMFFGSWAVAIFFHGHAGVGEVMRVLAFNFMLIPFGAVTMAWFRRELNYRPIFLIGLTANIVSFVVVLALALADFGYMSMAWSSLAGVVVTVALSIAMRPRDFPRWPALTGIGEVFRFGKHASGIYLFSQIGKSAPEGVIGKARDMAAVAFFSRANGLMEIFNRTVLRSVLPLCLPYFSKAVREGGDTREGYLKAVNLLTAVGWPFFLSMGVMAYGAIRLLYGQQFIDSVPLAQILCLVAVLELPYYMAGEVMIAMGRIDQSNKLQFIVQGMRLASLLLVFPYGLEGACWGLAGAAALGALVSQQILRRIIDLRFRMVIKACRASAAVALLTVAPSLAIYTFIETGEHNYLRMFVAAGTLTAIAWLLALRTCRHPFWDEIARLAAQIGQRVAGRAR